MKENWTYKKFEDCLDKVKYTSKVPSSDYLKDGLFPIVSQEEGLISGYWDEEGDVFKVQKPVVIFGDHTRILKYVDFDFVLGADGVKILQPIDGLSAKFLLYYLTWCNIPSLGYSRHYKLLKELDTPVPPIETQSRIVSELDLLQSIIDKQQAQLKELDKLAQAVFYDMFGDPVENEKGWEEKKVSEITKYYNGIAHEQDVDENGNFILINAKFISTQGETVKRTSMQRFPLFVDDIVMVLSDLPNGKSLGKCFLIDKNNLYSLNQRICCFRGFEGEAIFLKFVINRNPYFLSFDDGKGQTNLRKNDVENLPVIIPPLSLQQSFAAKIESIEKQKSAISQSITETQKLFNYTMDKYFG
jgi:type I restriction enzyme S subunit